MAAGFFISTRHSERHFELKTSEFRCEMKFWKSLHFYSEKLRKESDFRKNPEQNGLISASRVCFLHTNRNIAKPFEQGSVPNIGW